MLGKGWGLRFISQSLRPHGLTASVQPGWSWGRQGLGCSGRHTGAGAGEAGAAAGYTSGWAAAACAGGLGLARGCCRGWPKQCVIYSTFLQAEAVGELGLG